MGKFKILIRNLHWTFSFLVIAIIVGCNSDSQEANFATNSATIPQYSVVPEEATQQRTSPLIQEVKYIQLHLPKETYLREVRKLLFKNSSFYIFETNTTGDIPKIYSFDHTGKFNYVIDKPGRGPGEFEQIYDFGVTENSVVLSTPTKLMFYNKENGGFLKSIDKPQNSFIQTIAMMNDSILVSSATRSLSNQTKNLVKFYNIQSGKYVHEAIPFEDHALKTGHSDRYFYSYNDSLSVIPMYEQTVYRIVPEEKSYSLYPAYQFNFGEHWITEDLLADSYSDRGKFFNNSSNYVHTVDVFETEDVIYANYSWQGDSYTFIRDKEQNRSLNISGFTENKIGWVGEPEEGYKNWIINLVHPFEIEESDVSSDKRLQSILNNMSVHAHPFLVFVKFQIQ